MSPPQYCFARGLCPSRLYLECSCYKVCKTAKHLTQSISIQFLQRLKRLGALERQPQHALLHCRLGFLAARQELPPSGGILDESRAGDLCLFTT